MEDVLFGDVYICGGQSNMVPRLPVLTFAPPLTLLTRSVAGVCHACSHQHLSREADRKPISNYPILLRGSPYSEHYAAARSADVMGALANRQQYNHRQGFQQIFTPFLDFLSSVLVLRPGTIVAVVGYW